MVKGADRLWQVDALRGLMLLLMTATHLPTRFSAPLGQPFGYVSAAEGFVLLSGFMAGLVYTKRQQRAGDPEMRSAFFKRVLKIYLCQAALLLFLFSVITLIGIATDQAAVTGLLSFYMEKPLAALFGGLLLIYNPPLLDILPMYILFMLASPVLLVHGIHSGWRLILGASVALWLAAQFGLGHALYDEAVALTGLPVPFQETGSFQILAWQFLWVMGLWMGSTRAAGEAAVDFPRWMVRAAIAVGLTFFVWRHVVGQSPFPHVQAVELLFDKWQLAPMRLINLFALLVLAMHFAPWLSARLPRIRMLETLGAASLPVFCAHLVLALLALAIAGEPTDARSWWIDIVVFFGSMAALCVVAVISGHIDRQAAKVKASVAAKVQARRATRAATRMAKLTSRRTASQAAAQRLRDARK